MIRNWKIVRATAEGIRRRFPILLAGTLFVSVTSTGTRIAAQGLESKIESFYGGQLDLSFELALAGGADFGYASRYGRFLNGLSEKSNPAFAFARKQSAIKIAAGLPYRLDVGSFADISGQVHSSVDNAVAQYRTPSTQLVYPEISPHGKLATPFESASVAWRTPDFGFTVSFENVFHISLKARQVGAGARVSTPVETGQAESDVTLNAKLDAILEAGLDLRRFTAIFAFPTQGRVGLGLQMSSLFANVRSSGIVPIQASMLYAGQEYVFNDPAALWPTDLSQELDGQYSGSGWAVRLGLWYLLRPTTVVDVALHSGASLHCKGDLTIHQNRIPAFNIDALLWGDEDAEVLDASRLKLSQLTLTEPVDNPTYPELGVTTPAFLRVGLLQQSKSVDVSLSGQLFIGEYALSYGADKIMLVPTWRLEFNASFWKIFARVAGTRLSVSTDGSRRLQDLRTSLVLPDVFVGLAQRYGKGVVLTHLFRLLPLPCYQILVGIDL